MLIFDFDGVLVDSLDEVIVNAYNAVTGEHHSELQSLPASYVTLYRRNRFHVQPAGDLLTLARWCAEERDAAKILSRGEYQALLAQETESLDARREKFFSTRAVFVERNRAAWVALNHPYHPLWDALQKVPPSRLPILTNKNRRAVLDLCTHYGLPLDETLVYSGDHGVTKHQNLQKIRARFPDEAHFSFVDDSIHNLLDLRDERAFTPLLATWGYVGQSCLESAETAGVACVTQQEIVAMLCSGN